MDETFLKRSRIPASAGEVFRWHLRPEALPELTPPWEPAELVERTGGPDRVGSRVVLKVGPRPFGIRWVAEHTGFERDRWFRDVQVKGPFARWEHTHTMEPDGPHACWLEDRIVWALPLAPLSHWIAAGFVRRKIERMFDYRHRVTREAFRPDSAP